MLLGESCSVASEATAQVSYLWNVTQVRVLFLCSDNTSLCETVSTIIRIVLLPNHDVYPVIYFILLQIIKSKLTVITCFCFSAGDWLLLSSVVR